MDRRQRTFKFGFFYDDVVGVSRCLNLTAQHDWRLDLAHMRTAFAATRIITFEHFAGVRPQDVLDLL